MSLSKPALIRPDQGTLHYCCFHGHFDSLAQIWDKLRKGENKPNSGFTIDDFLRPTHMLARKKRENYFEFVLKFSRIVTTTKVNKLIKLLLEEDGKTPHDCFSVKLDRLESCLHSLLCVKSDIADWKQFAARNAKPSSVNDIMGFEISVEDVEEYGRQQSAEASEVEWEDLKRANAAEDEANASSQVGESTGAEDEGSSDECSSLLRSTEVQGGASKGKRQCLTGQEHPRTGTQRWTVELQQTIYKKDEEIKNKEKKNKDLQTQLDKAVGGREALKEAHGEQIKEMERRIKEEKERHEAEMKRFQDNFNTMASHLGKADPSLIEKHEAEKRKMEEQHQRTIQKVLDEVKALKKADEDKHNKIEELGKELENSRALLDKAKDEVEDLKESFRAITKQRDELLSSFKEDSLEYVFVKNIPHPDVVDFRKTYNLVSREDYVKFLSRQMKEQILWFLLKRQNVDKSRLPEGEVFKCTADRVYKDLYNENMRNRKQDNPHMTKEDRLEIQTLCRTYVRLFFFALIDRENNEHPLAPVKKRKHKEQSRTYSFKQTGGVVTIESVVKQPDGSERQIQAKITKVGDDWYKDTNDAVVDFLEELESEDFENEDFENFAVNAQ